MSGSRLRFLADQIRLGVTESDVGDVIFEPGTVNGVSATVIRSLLIGDLTVDTLQLANESVTLPNISTLATDLFGNYSGWNTFIEDNFSITGVAGSTIYLQIQADIVTHGQNAGPVPCPVQLLLNNTTVLDSFTGGESTRFLRFTIATVTATGSAQTINLKWQFFGQSPNFNGIFSGAKAIRVAMKR